MVGRVYAQGEAVILNNAVAMGKFGVLILDTLYRQQVFSAKDVQFLQIPFDYIDGFEVAHRVREFNSVPIWCSRPKCGGRTCCAALKRVRQEAAG